MSRIKSWVVFSVCCLGLGGMSESRNADPAPLPPEPLGNWVGDWADGGDARVRINAEGRFVAELVTERIRFRPDSVHVHEEQRDVEGELPSAVSWGPKPELQAWLGNTPSFVTPGAMCPCR